LASSCNFLLSAVSQEKPTDAAGWFRLDRRQSPRRAPAAEPRTQVFVSFRRAGDQEDDGAENGPAQEP
jgi:hypothetical protein